MKNYFLFTTDVETTSIVNHRLSDETGKLVAREAIPKILDIYHKHDIYSTFFITGYFAEKFPEAVKQIYNAGHEIGCHGYSHDHTAGFDILNLKQQKEHLAKAKRILEDIISNEVTSFRSPALRTNKYTVKALIETGFKIDSSVSSQRFDFFFSLGSKEKLAWLKAPRKPYLASTESLSKSGDSSIFEIPISAFVIPYIGTTMRIFPNTIQILRIILKNEASKKGNPVNFLIHPIELILEERTTEKIAKRSHNIITYILSDALRHNLKTKNLGDKAVDLLHDQINYFQNENFKFITCKEYYQRTINGTTTRNY